MDFKKRFDYKDINSYLPDNQTIGTMEYYREKTNNKLPEEEYFILETRARVEYSDEDIKNAYVLANQFKLHMHNKLLKELEEREDKDYENNYGDDTYEKEMNDKFNEIKIKLSE
jgi:hypothetical protein